MRYTQNYELKMPDESDYINLDDFNHNAEVIDQKIKEIEDKSSSAKTDTTEINTSLTKLKADFEKVKKESGGNASNLTELNNSLRTINSSLETLRQHASNRGNPHGVTKNQVGLGNVSNVEQMPVRNGTLENYSEKLVRLSGTTINLSEGNVFHATVYSSTRFSFINSKWNTGHSFTLVIEAPNATTINFPSNVKWHDGEAPDLSKGGKTYVLSFVTLDNGNTWLGMLGGRF